MDANQTNTSVTFTVNKSSVPPGCLVIFHNNYLPWENPENLVSAETETLVRRWKDSLILPILFLIGGPGNIINIAVFFKQGLKERINVCLFALSLADFVFLLQTFLLNCESIPFNTKDRYGPMAVFIINHNLTGFYGFHYVSQALSTIIATERCFCIIRPLRAHSFLSTSTTTIIIIIIKIVMVGGYFFVMTRYRIVCAYDPVNQVTSLEIVTGEFYNTHQIVIDYLDVIVYGAGLPGLSMLVVTVTTILTMVKLRQAASWRAETSSSGRMSSKEIALTRMLVANSLLFIVCVCPNVFFRFWLYLTSNMNVGSGQHNLFLVCIWILDVVSWTNSTFNIIIYFAMGSRYRQTFFSLMPSCPMVRWCRQSGAGMRKISEKSGQESATATSRTKP